MARLIAFKAGLPGQTRQRKRHHGTRGNGEQRNRHISGSSIEMRDNQGNQSRKDAAHGPKEKAAGIAKLSIDLGP